MMRAIFVRGRRLFSWACARGAWMAALALAGVGAGLLPPAPCASPDEGGDLYQRQADVRATLQHVSASMQRLAEKLEGAQPEDARRLRDAAEKIRVIGLEGLLSEIGDLLKKPNFLEAVLRQDEAIRELDEIIALLEKARTEGGSESERQEKLANLLREVSQIQSRQEGLLKKTRDFLSKAETVKALSELKGRLSDIAREQRALNEGGDPRAIDPQGEKDDEAALEEALALAQGLLDAQKRVEERAAAISTEKVPLDEVRSLADRLDGLIDQAGDFVDTMESAGPDDAGAAPQAKAGKETAGKPAPAGDRKGLIEQAHALSEEIGALEADAARDAPSAKESLAKARSEAGGAEAGLRSGSRERALASGKSLLRDLKEARREVGRELGSLEEKNASETAGLVQEQSILERKASEGASRMEGASRQGSSEAARASLREASEAVKEASGSMREAAESLAEGARREGAEASSEAARDLSRAREAIEKGRKALSGRTAAEKAADLQKKLARKTEEAGKKVEELQKKIGKKAEGASQALAEAQGLMGQAAGAHRSGDGALAKEKGEEALERIEKASEDLDEDEALARLQKESPRKDAAEQEELARLTRELSRKSREDGASSRGSGGQSQDLQGASESMERAGQNLRQEAAESAAKDQEEALARLKAARDQLREEQEELARLNKERDMTSMVEELTKIKEGQERINSETVKIHATRGPQESRFQARKVQTEVSKLALLQGGLAEQVDKLADRLQEELSRVFRFVLQNVGADMRQVRDSLQDLETGAYTQFLEKEIVDDIDRLLTALKDELSRLARKEPQSDSMGMDAGDEAQRLVPVVAELRMLRGMQVEVNRKTRDLDDLRKASASGATESWDRALERLLQKQGIVSRMTGELLEDFRKATGSAAPEGSEPPGE